ncbi:hypothetical protein FACS189426_04360 [Bacteroidia bacterium]|nr:hypothetical protein FACS189426_04360 [Bacteroidia bacterium]
MDVENIFSQVENIVELQPDSAIILLDSILYPEDLRKSQWNKYTLLQVQAKDKSYRDIASDTVIFAVKNYYLQKKNFRNAALAAFYSGRVYQSRNDFKQAISAYLQAETISQKTEDDKQKGLIQYFIGGAYYEHENYSEAIDHFIAAQQYFSRSSDNDKREIQTLNIIGSSYFMQENRDSAFIYFNKALQLAKAYNDTVVDKELESTIHLNLAHLYYELQQKDSANFYFNTALDFFEANDKISSLSNAYNLFSQLEEKGGNYRKALEYHQKHTQYLETIIGEIENNSLREIKRKYHLKKIRNEKDRLLIKRQWIFLDFLIILLVVGIISFYLYSKNLQEEAIRLKMEIWHKLGIKP